MGLFNHKVIGLCFLATIASATLHYHEIPEFKKPIIPIIKQNFDQHKEGYQYSYETGNGIHVQETGFIKNKGDKKHETLIQQGSITYHDEHGQPITLTYIADEHGFQPQGAHLPTPPPIPEEIKKSLVQHEVVSSHHSGFQQQGYYQHLDGHGHEY